MTITTKATTSFFTFAFLVGLFPLVASRSADQAASSGVLIVIDEGGKEHKLNAWKFVAGTRPLGWLTACARTAEGKKEHAGSAGAIALEFRDDHSTDYEDGIVTLVPLERLRSLEFDQDKRTVTARVA